MGTIRVLTELVLSLLLLFFYKNSILIGKQQ